MAGGRYHLQLGLAGGQVVLGLQGHGHLETPRLCGGHGELHLPAGVIGQPYVADLAGAHGGVEERQGFLDRGQRVEGVHLIQIDCLEAEPSQGGVQGAIEVAARRPGLVRVRAGFGPGLGGDDGVIGQVGGSGREPPSDGLFGNAAVVDVGRVDQAATRLDERVELRECLLFRGGVGAEVHRAERDGGHERPAAAEVAVLHDQLLLSRKLNGQNTARTQ